MTPPPSDSDSEFERAVQSAKLRALAEFAAGAGHEINNPIATIVGYAQQLLATETDPDRRHALATIGGQAYRVRDMIGDLMLFARPPQPRPVLLDLAEACRDVIARFAEDAARQTCRIDLDAPLPVPILADPAQLRVVIAALVRNALVACSAAGCVTVSAAMDESDGRPAGVLCVTDNGRGLSAADREHLFDPFYSGRQAGRGLGFGLPKSWRIVTLHGGRIVAESPPEGGARFTIHWPG